MAYAWFKMNLSKNTTRRNSRLRAEASRTFLKFVDRIASVTKLPILDVPCGYGRHAFVLASLGYKVICADIDRDALDAIRVLRRKHGFPPRRLTTLEVDLTRRARIFKKRSCGAIVNIHYYQHNLIRRFVELLASGGYPPPTQRSYGGW